LRHLRREQRQLLQTMQSLEDKYCSRRRICGAPLDLVSRADRRG